MSNFSESQYGNKEIVSQGPCPKCSSSDAFTVYEANGKQDGWCFSCGHFSPDVTGEVPTQPRSQTFRANTSDLKVDLEYGKQHSIRGLPARMISHATAEHFNVRVGVSEIDGETPLYTLFPRYRDGHQIGWKTITPDKQILNTGGSQVDLFGQHLCKPTGKKLWITEGEIDALSVYQALKENSSIPDWSPAVVSLPDGCLSATKSIGRNLDFVEGYDEVIIVFDNDGPGRLAREEACKLLAGRVHYVDLDLKDANEYLKANRSTDLKWACLSHYKKYQPDGVVNPRDLWEEYNSIDNTEIYPYPDTMPTLNEKIRGARPGTIVTLTSGTGCGKTQVLREFMHHFYKSTDEKIAGMFLEEDKRETMKGLVSLELNTRLHLPEHSVGEDAEKKAFDDMFSSGRFELYDFFGGMNDSTLFSKLKYFAAEGHKFIFLDHLSIIVSEYASKGGERERIDTIMTKLAKFVKEFNVVLFLVVHLRKGEGANAFETGVRPTLDDLRGSGTLKQLSWDVIALTRNQQHEDRYAANVVELSVLKSRFTGSTGTAGYLHFNEDTGRMVQCEKPLNFPRPAKVSLTKQDEAF